MPQPGSGRELGRGDGRRQGPTCLLGPSLGRGAAGPVAGGVEGGHADQVRRVAREVLQLHAALGQEQRLHPLRLVRPLRLPEVDLRGRRGREAWRVRGTSPGPGATCSRSRPLRCPATAAGGLDGDVSIYHPQSRLLPPAFGRAQMRPAVGYQHPCGPPSPAARSLPLPQKCPGSATLQGALGSLKGSSTPCCRNGELHPGR